MLFVETMVPFVTVSEQWALRRVEIKDRRPLDMNNKILSAARLRDIVVMTGYLFIVLAFISLAGRSVFDMDFDRNTPFYVTEKYMNTTDYAKNG